jgi:hypothetical protein
VLETLEALGNAGVVPIVILFTQLFKKRFGDFKYGSDLLALGLSMVLCVGWVFYYMTPEAFNILASSDFLVQFRWGIDQLIMGFATWLAASKIYDLGHGNKKREKRQLEETEKLTEEIVKLKNGNGDMNGQTEEDPVVADKLRNILEG